MESWWDENHYEFEARRMQVVDHACVAATKGKRMASGEHMFEEEYADSAVRLRQLIAKNVQHAPWFPSPGWMAQITEDLADYYEGAKEKSATQTRDMHPEDYRSGNRLLDFLQWLLQLGPRIMQPTRRYIERVDGGTHRNQRGWETR
ncbi:hypothetical protein BD779DRAFT_1531252 [Infundibulicybe gibba]|nr:hypothetical protein BD779DRAFT_1531252 [Infundibulicybe gibba]